MVILLVFQTKGHIRPTTLIIIGISMQTLFIALVQGLTLQQSNYLQPKLILGWSEVFTVNVLKSTFILGMVIVAVIPLLFLVIPKMKISCLMTL